MGLYPQRTRQPVVAERGCSSRFPSESSIQAITETAIRHVRDDLDLEGLDIDGLKEEEEPSVADDDDDEDFVPSRRRRKSEEDDDGDDDY